MTEEMSSGYATHLKMNGAGEPHPILIMGHHAYPKRCHLLSQLFLSAKGRCGEIHYNEC